MIPQSAFVDPRNIVNRFCVRPVLPSDIAVVKEGFRTNGYVDSHLISCRFATAPEIEEFYSGAPYNYSPEKSKSVTKSLMQQGNSGEHYYCYDGHIRKYASMELIDEKIFEKGFKLKSIIMHHMSKEEEIAYSLSRNSTQEFSVPLSFLGLLLRCYEYEQVVNEGKVKLLSAAEVGKRMVNSSTTSLVDSRTKNKLAETRRQIVGICRKLPLSVITFFRELCLNDSGVQRAFTMANLKCIKKANEHVLLALVKRMVHSFTNSLPTPKPLHPSLVPDQIVFIQRALKEIKKFKDLCEYENVPNELSIIVENMMNTQRVDDELEENATKDQLLPVLYEGCSDKVAGGTVHLDVAQKKLSGGSSIVKGNENDDTAAIMDTCNEDQDSGDAVGRGKVSNSGMGSGIEAADEMSANADKNSYSSSGAETNPTDTESGGNGECSNISSLEVSKTDSVDTILANNLPKGWNLLNTSFEDFVKLEEGWHKVQGKADLVLMQLPPDENNDSLISEVVRHAGVAMQLNGVAHVFCTHLQFGKVYAAAVAEGMECMRYPMLYVEAPTKTKKRTLKQRPQENSKPAAVFWRSPDPGTKHYFSSSASYPHSSTPEWTNTVTNVMPPDEKLRDTDGAVISYQDWDKDVLSFILREWCSPAGMCYNPLSGTMGAALACYDLGIQYVASEANETWYTAGTKRLVGYVTKSMNKRRKTSDDNKAVPSCARSRASFCGIGKDFCIFPNQVPTYVCQGGCGKKMHDLCDFAKVFKKRPLEERELVSVCSNVCLEKE